MTAEAAGWDGLEHTLWSQTDLGSGPNSASYLLCDLEELTFPEHLFPRLRNVSHNTGFMGFWWGGGLKRNKASKVLRIIYCTF